MDIKGYITKCKILLKQSKIAVAKKAKTIQSWLVSIEAPFPIANEQNGLLQPFYVKQKKKGY